MLLFCTSWVKNWVIQSEWVYLKQYILQWCIAFLEDLFYNQHFVKSARIRSYSGPYFPAFGLNTERYSVSLCIQHSVRILENADQNNSEYGHFLRSANKENLSSPALTSRKLFSCSTKIVSHCNTIFNDTHWGNSVLPNFSTRTYWNRSLAASDIFPMFMQSINFYTFYCHIVKSTDDFNQIDKNNWLLLSTVQEGLRQNLRWFST